METLPFEIGETAHALRKAFDRRACGLGVTRAQWKVLFRLERQPGLDDFLLAADVKMFAVSTEVDAGSLFRIEKIPARQGSQLGGSAAPGSMSLFSPTRSGQPRQDVVTVECSKRHQ